MNYYSFLGSQKVSDERAAEIKTHTKEKAQLELFSRLGQGPKLEVTYTDTPGPVVPEFPLGTMMGVMACFAAVAVIGIKRRTLLK